jgi:quinol monooxygenase YgiN
MSVDRYENKAAAEKHPTEAHFKETFAKFDAEGVLAKPAYIAHTKSVAGFDSNRSLL